VADGQLAKLPAPANEEAAITDHERSGSSFVKVAKAVSKSRSVLACRTLDARAEVFYVFKGNASHMTRASPAHRGAFSPALFPPIKEIASLSRF
jgi:hypothetical protein